MTHDMQSPSGIIGPPLPREGRPFGDPVMIEGKPAAFVECTVLCSGSTSAGMAHPPPGAGSPPATILLGSPTVLINGRPAARWAPSGDIATCTGMLGDAKLLETRTVSIGGPTLPAGMKLSVDLDGALRIGNALAIHGSDEFKALVLNRLVRILSTNVGSRVLGEIERSGKSVRVKQTHIGNSWAAPRDFIGATLMGAPIYDAHGQVMRGPSGKPYVGSGQGSDVDLSFNPFLRLENKNDASAPMPSDAVLFHELEHSNHAVNGTLDTSPRSGGWDTQEEETTIESGATSERAYLEERGYPWHRSNHSHDWVANP